MNLAVTDGTAGDCNRRCDALQASQRDDGKELSGVVQLAFAVMMTMCMIMMMRMMIMIMMVIMMMIMFMTMMPPLSSDLL